MSASSTRVRVDFEDSVRTDRCDVRFMDARHESDPKSGGGLADLLKPGLQILVFNGAGQKRRMGSAAECPGMYRAHTKLGLT